MTYIGGLAVAGLGRMSLFVTDGAAVRRCLRQVWRWVTDKQG